MKLQFEKAEHAEKFLGKRVKITGKVVEVKSGTLGLKALGALDYLENYHSYIIKYVK